MVEIYFNIQSDNGSITEDHGLRQWSTKFMSALAGTKDLRIPLRLGQMITNAGLVGLQARMIPLPLCGWSNGTKTRPPFYRFRGSSSGTGRALPFADQMLPYRPSGT